MFWGKTESQRKPSQSEINAAWEERDKAESERRKRCYDAIKNHEPFGPAFKIIETNHGQYEIHRRDVVPANYYEAFYSSFLMYERELMPLETADDIRAKSVEPIERYEAIRNDKAPIVTKRSGYSYSSYDESVTGYAPLIFNVFAEAEAYLKRMTAKRPKEVGYDFPPLKKRETTEKLRLEQ